MSIDFLNELEDKVQALITALDNVRKENDQLREELHQNSNKISDMESENDQLKAELEMLKNDSQNQQNTTITAERIQGFSEIGNGTTVIRPKCNWSGLYELVHGKRSSCHFCRVSDQKRWDRDHQANCRFC